MAVTNKLLKVARKINNQPKQISKIAKRTKD
jgi:hypothetical protein